MSRIKLEGHENGTGTVTITAPNTNTDRAITIPDEGGAILTEVSSLSATNVTSGTLPIARIADGAVTNAKLASGISSSKLSGALPAIDGSALTGITTGKVLQVVSATTSVNESTTSSTFQTSAYCRASITPSATTSKIFVIASFEHYQSGDNADSEIGFRLIETNSSDASGEIRDRTYGYSGSGVLHQGETTLTWLHSPSTTSQRTYAVQYKKLSGANACNIQDTGDGTVTLFEIDGS